MMITMNAKKRCNGATKIKVKTNVPTLHQNQAVS